MAAPRRVGLAGLVLAPGHLISLVLASRCPAGQWTGFPASRRPEFMRDYWGKRPLLIRELLPAEEASAILSPDELAGVACEDGVEGRIICESGLGDNGPWTLLHGPFDVEDFAHLPEGGWTLLVNEMNIVVPQVAALLDEGLASVPRWRRDDVMVSYAADGGGIGAHVDNYDVFLIQGRGRRRWCIEQRLRPAAEERLEPGLSVRVLRDFEPDASWELEAGDCLYLPPRVPHRGVALGEECMTLSVGYRAPGKGELLRGVADWAAEACAEDATFRDTPGTLGVGEGSGQIPADALAELENMVVTALDELRQDRRALRTWLAERLTDRRRAPLEFEGTTLDLDHQDLLNRAVAAARAGEDVEEAVGGLALWRAEGVPFAYCAAGALGPSTSGGRASSEDQADQSPLLLVSGRSTFIHAADAHQAARELRCLDALCGANPVDLEEAALHHAPGVVAQLGELLASGEIYWAPRGGEWEGAYEGETSRGMSAGDDS